MDACALDKKVGAQNGPVTPALGPVITWSSLYKKYRASNDKLILERREEGNDVLRSGFPP